MMTMSNDLSRKLIIIPLSLILAGCPVRPLLDYNPGSPPMVSLPLSSSGVVDERASFALSMAEELQRSEIQYRGSTPAEWLHNVGFPIGAPEKKSRTAIVVASRTSVLVIPGIFGDCVAEQSLPFSDGVVRGAANYIDGYRYLADLGLASIRAVKIKGRASSEQNGQIIADDIQLEAEKPGIDNIVLIAYSKGAPDALEALRILENGSKGNAKVKALVTMSGVVLGTPIADAHAEDYSKYGVSLRPLSCSASEGGEIQSLTRQSRLVWWNNYRLSDSILRYSIVAHTNTDDVSPGLSAFHKLLNYVDPKNDGQVLMSDAVLPKAKLLAEVKSDHWIYVLPLEKNPNELIRTIASPRSFPRGAFIRAVIHTVLVDLQISNNH